MYEVVIRDGESGPQHTYRVDAGTSDTAALAAAEQHVLVEGRDSDHSDIISIREL